MTTNNTLSLQDQINALMAENAALKQKAVTGFKAKSLSLKVSQKGAVSIYGLGRFPVTLYKSQVLKLAEAMNDIVKFTSENDKLLATKESPTAIA